MYLKNEVVLVWFICLSCKVVTAGCQVVLVERNVTDSFRVGKDGCTKDINVCTSYGSSCLSDGQCLCPTAEPNFRRPTNTKVYGCLNNLSVRSGIGASIYCPLGPFQLIPSTRQPDSAAAQFTDANNLKGTLLGCTLTKAEAKFPNRTTETELQWLNESYVELTIVNNKTLQLQWKKSVPDLRGTIITLHLYCRTSSVSFSLKCLRAKILGTWPADKNPPDPEAPVASDEPTTASTAQSTKSTTSDETATPQTSVTTSQPGELSSSDDDSSGTIVIIAVVVPVVLLIVLVVVVLWLCKRKKWYSQRYSSDGLSNKKNGIARLKQFRHTDSNLRGREDGQDAQVGAQANHGYSTPDSQRVILGVNPVYATSDVKTKEKKSVNYNEAPGYETVDMKKRERNDQDDPGYATPDINRREINRVNSYPEPGYETPDIKKKEINVTTDDSAYSTPEKNTKRPNDDVERVNVKGDLYALPNKSTKKINGLNYMNPSALVTVSKDETESQAKSSQPTEYAEVVGVMKKS